MPKKTEAATVKRVTADLVPLCGCAGCQPLEQEFQADPVLLSFLKRALLKRGWAGIATPAEKSYQRAHSTWAAGMAERAAELAARTRFGTTAETAEFGEKPATGTDSMPDALSDAILAQGTLL